MYCCLSEFFFFHSYPWPLVSLFSTFEFDCPSGFFRLSFMTKKEYGVTNQDTNNYTPTKKNNSKGTAYLLLLSISNNSIEKSNIMEKS